MDTRDTRSTSAGLLVAAAAVAATTGAIYGLREIMPEVATGVLYLLAVLLVSGYWGRWLGLLTALLSAASFNFFHIPPTGRFTIAEEENWLALGVFLVVAIVTSALAAAARDREQEAERRRREADLSAEMSRLLLGGTSIEESLPAVGERIAKAFGLPYVSIEPSWVDSDERRRALPLRVGGSRAGTMLIPRDADLELREILEERVVPALETLLGAAKRREQLEAQVIETKALRRTDAMKTALLRAVSHDLRSPLTAIRAAAGGVGSDTLPSEQRRELASVIELESARLSRLVDNLLDLSRLQAGGVEPRADWISVEELVRAAVASVPSPEARFDVDLDPDLPLVLVDAVQLERALANVLDNCARYSENVAIRAHPAGRQITLRVSDRGPGIPKDELERIFEPFHRVDEARDGGSGLGLAIARGFVEANGGRLRAESLPGQGASFVLQLPVPAERAAEALEGERPVA